MKDITRIKVAIAVLMKDAEDAIEKLNNVIKRGNQQFYVNKYEEEKTSFYKNARSLELLLHRVGKYEEEQMIKKIVNSVKNSQALKRTTVLGIFEKCQTFLVDLDARFDTAKTSSFEIPRFLPDDIRLDIEEAIKNHENNCYLSSQVMCRRAYESALRYKYKEVEGKEPREDIVCLSCKKIIRPASNLSITNLHKWAVSKNIIHEKLQSIGYLLPEMAAGSAHATEKPIPRDKQVSKFVIEATLALLARVYNQK